MAHIKLYVFGPPRLECNGQPINAALARRRPLCALIEDIHSALLNVLEFVAARAQDVPLLIVAQARPELLERRPSRA